MRYADGPTVSVDEYVDAAPARVWQLVCDINLPGRFSNEFDGAEWLEGARAPVVGARFLGRNHHPAIGSWETTSFITACEPERLLEWAVSDPRKPASLWRFELESEGAGTRLRQRARLGPGPSGTSIEIDRNPRDEEQIIDRRLREHRTNMQRTIKGIKMMAECGTTGLCSCESDLETRTPLCGPSSRQPR